MKKLLLLICLLVTTQVFALNVQPNKNTTEVITQKIEKLQNRVGQSVAPKKEKMTWKERKALKILNKRIQKIKRKNSSDVGSFMYTVGLIIAILGLIGLVLGLLNVTGIGIGIGGILFGLVLMLIGRYLL